jgi:hypothetical protein
VYVYDETWDNLIILDACRYDSFKEMNVIDGRLESRISRGSSSVEFLLENFTRHPKYSSFRDVVYVAANPFVSSLVPDRFYKIYPVWDYGWNDNLNTVTPSTVATEANTARERYPDKRLIIHFMQPHFPALISKLKGDTGLRGLREAVQTNVNLLKPWKHLDWTPELLLEMGKLDKKDVWAAYKENLKMVLACVASLIKELPGRTVVTSDHGDLFGERQGIIYPFKMFGHPEKTHVKTLVLVPWLIVDNAKGAIDRVWEEPKTSFDYSPEVQDKIRDRLRKLGYE